MGQPRSLAPGEQFWVDVGQIKQSQVPDAKGQVFPVAATSGTYEIEDMNDSDVGSLYEGKLTVDKTFGHAAYGCAVCCTKSPIWIEPYPISLGFGGTTQCQLYATDSCTGGTVVTNGGAATWSSTVPSVATINPDALLTGVTLGSSTIKASLTTRVYGPGGKVDRCVPLIVTASAPATVQVPTSATIISNIKQTYSNQTWTSCDTGSSLPNRYGYRRCVEYQVKDQFSPPGDIHRALAIHEDISTVDSNYTSNNHSGDSSTNADGIFQDELALLGTSVLPGNACSIVKQSFKATGNPSPIRVNCVQYSSSDATITDVTSNPGQCSKPTYHCN